MILNKKLFYLTLIIVLVGYFAWKNPRIRKIVAKIYFDKNYYIEHYPDVGNNNSLEHYVRYGIKQKRNPNKIAEFITKIKWKLTAKKVEPLENAKYYLSVATMFQNEARFLKEWIEFYKLMGIDHFYLYDHLSVDNYQEVLQPYINSGLVELKKITKRPANSYDFFMLQTEVHNAILQQTKNETEWLIVVDTDEFLFPVKEQNLKTVLKNYDKYASVSVNWRLFGSDNVEKLKEDGLLIEQLTKCSINKDLHVKSIIKPRYASRFISNTHFAEMKSGYYQVTENFEPFYGPFSPTQSFNIFRINHYWARDWEFFRSNKLSRIHVTPAIDLQIQFNKTISRDYDNHNSILRFIEPLKKNVFDSNYSR